jgi:hypothetical protein
MRLAAVPRTGRAADSRGLDHAHPAADSNAVRRASRMARQTAQMTSSHPDERERAGGVGSGTRPRVTAVRRARCGYGGRIGSRSGADRGVEVARPAHLVTAGGSSSCRCRGLEQQCRCHQTLARSRGAANVQPSQTMPCMPCCTGRTQQAALAWRSAGHGQHGPGRDPSGDWDDRRAAG